MDSDTRPLRRPPVFLLLLLTWGCVSEEPQTLKAPEQPLPKSGEVMKLTSSGFENGAKLDAKYTVEGQDISPPLSWAEAPSGTKSFALISCDQETEPNS